LFQRFRQFQRGERSDSRRSPGDGCDRLRFRKRFSYTNAYTDCNTETYPDAFYYTYTYAHSYTHTDTQQRCGGDDQPIAGFALYFVKRDFYLERWQRDRLFPFGGQFATWRRYLQLWSSDRAFDNREQRAY
jgi:hypothetical protein